MAGNDEVVGPKVALFIDIRNGLGLDMRLIMNVARLLGRVEVAKGFAPFSLQNRGIDRQALELERVGVDLIHCPPRPEDPEIDDKTMQEHIKRTLERRPEIERFVLCTGDGRFADEVELIRATGRVAFVIGPPGSTSSKLVKAATVCLTVPVLGKGNGPQDDGHRLEVQGQTAGGNGHRLFPLELIGRKCMKQGKEEGMRDQHQTTERKVALFIDYLNTSGVDMAAVVRKARQLGQIEVAWAYGRFYCRGHRLSQRAEDLRRLGVQLFHCPDLNTGPGDVTDAAMMLDIFVTLYERPEIDCYVLCTADGDFVNVLTGIRVLDREAVVIGPANGTAKALRKEAHRFFIAPYLGKGQDNGRCHSGTNGRSRMSGKNESN